MIKSISTLMSLKNQNPSNAFKAQCGLTPDDLSHLIWTSPSTLWSHHLRLNFKEGFIVSAADSHDVWHTVKIGNIY